MLENQDGGSPESISRQFLSALSEGRWEAAADLISPESAERLRAQLLYVNRHVAHPPLPHGATDTVFRGPLELLHVEDAEALRSLPARDLLVRWIGALHPANVAADRDSGIPPRIEYVVLGCEELTPSRAVTRYRMEWHSPDGRRLRDREQTLALARTDGGWRIADADLSGSGNGHLAVPDDAWERFKDVVRRT